MATSLFWTAIVMLNDLDLTRIILYMYNCCMICCVSVSASEKSVIYDILPDVKKKIMIILKK